MSSVVARSRAVLVRAWRIDAALTASALLMLVALTVCAVGLSFDPRVLLGAPLWLKPAKFAVSIAVYCVTLIWLFNFIPAFERTRRVVGWTTAGAMCIEMGIIGAQAARGTTSHFNVSSPLNIALFAIMGTAILVQTLSTVAVAVALFRQRFADRPLGWALRLGLLISIAGASLAGLMTRPTQAQLVELRAGQVLVAGAHTVGAPDGGPGIPVTGWSRGHGDLRVAHFMGLHALQVLPLLALALRRTRRTEEQRQWLVLSLAGSYAGLVGILLWQALRGQPPFAPDPSTLAALLGWLTLTVAATWCSLAGRALPSGSVASLS